MSILWEGVHKKEMSLKLIIKNNYYERGEKKEKVDKVEVKTGVGSQKNSARFWQKKNKKIE